MGHPGAPCRTGAGLVGSSLLCSPRDGNFALLADDAAPFHVHIIPCVVPLQLVAADDVRAEANTSDGGSLPPGLDGQLLQLQQYCEASPLEVRRGDGADPRPHNVHYAYGELPNLGIDMKMSTWNCHALFHTHSSTQKKAAHKLSMLSKLLDKHHIIALQEVHGNESDLHNLMGIYSKHLWYYSFMPNRAAGGILIAIAKSFAFQFEAIWWRPRGRVRAGCNSA